MKIGISNLRVPGASWKNTLEIAKLAEELGYSCITTGEAWGEDAFTSLAQVAAVTERIRIGTSIVPVFARTPSNIAMTALNMDRMSEGRFFLGLGASGRLVIEDFHGEQFRKPLSRMREYISIIRKAAAGERLNHDGEFFKLQRFRIRFQPYRSHLPIYIASLTQASLRLTGEVADGWLPIFLGAISHGTVASGHRGGRQRRRQVARRHIYLSAGVHLRHRRHRRGPQPRATAHRLLHRRHGRLLPPIHAPHRLRGGGRQSQGGLPGPGARSCRIAGNRRDGGLHHHYWNAPTGVASRCRHSSTLAWTRYAWSSTSPDMDSFTEVLKAVAPART